MRPACLIVLLTALVPLVPDPRSPLRPDDVPEIAKRVAGGGQLRAASR